MVMLGALGDGVSALHSCMGWVLKGLSKFLDLVASNPILLDSCRGGRPQLVGMIWLSFSQYWFATWGFGKVFDKKSHLELIINSIGAQSLCPKSSWRSSSYCLSCSFLGARLSVLLAKATGLLATRRLSLSLVQRWPVLRREL